MQASPPPFDQAPGPVRDPISEIVESPQDAVLAVIVGVDGPSYRPLGASMAIFADGTRVGSLSSGCIEADLAEHAKRALARGAPTVIRYGRGSPYMDIQLPCGGGLQILLVPRPDREVLGQVVERVARREVCGLEIDENSGDLRLAEVAQTGRDGGIFRLRFLPGLRFYVFGKGPEASTFAALVQSARYENILFSPDGETLDFGRAAGCATRHLKRATMPARLVPDAWTAVVLFFHDHEMEPDLLAQALETPSFFIGAQGSQRARDARLAALRAQGVSPDKLTRLRGPIGLVPSARDARTLAVSVLAEVLEQAMARGLLSGTG